MVLGSVAIGGGGFAEALGSFSVKASAGLHDGLNYVINGEKTIITGYDEDTGTEVSIPYEIDGFPVTIISDNAFSNCTTIKSITIPETIVNIGDNSFYGCTALSEVYYLGTEADWSFISVGDGNESLLNSDFFYLGNVLPGRFGKLSYRINGEEAEIIGCESSASGKMNIPSEINGFSVATIKACAFEGTELTDIIIPDSVKTIEDSAFRSCSKLKSIYIGSGVNLLYGFSFVYCHNLETIDVSPDNQVYHSSGNCLIETKEKRLIRGCNKSVIPTDGSVICIGCDSFSGDFGLTYITIPDTIKTIENGAFWACHNLERIVIPDSVVRVESAFRECEHLKSISFGSNVEYIGDDFTYCYGLEEITVSPSNKFYYSSGNCLIDSRSKQLILGCNNSVLPNDNCIESIGEYAFGHCKNLTSISIPDSVLSIGYHAFRDSGLESISIGKNVSHIDQEAFYGCTKIKKIEVSPDNKSYYSSGNCLVDKSSETLVLGCINSVIPTNNSLTRIGECAFYGCELVSIVIPDNIEEIGDYAFGDCYYLKTVTIGNGVKTIGNYAFYSCFSLENITNGNGVMRIGENAFEYCRSLSSAEIPKNVVEMDGNPFVHCENLKKVTVSEDNQIYYSYDNCVIEKSTGTIVIGCQNGIIPRNSSIKAIGKYAFTSLDGVDRIIIPENIKRIGNTAFYDCGFSMVQLENGVLDIDDYAFGRCFNLKAISVPKSVRNIGSNFLYTFYIVENYYAVIYGYIGSYAQQYAEDNNIPFYPEGLMLKGIMLNKNKSKLSISKTEQLTVSFAPKGSPSQDIYWASNNSSVAVVDENGLVKAISAGTATIIATSVVGGFTAKCEFTVTQPVSSVSVNKNSTTIVKGKTEQLSATISPSNASDKNVTWSSSDTSVATVSSTGKVTAKKAGTAKITVKTNDGGKTASCTVTVINDTIKVNGVKLNHTNLTVYVNTCGDLRATVTPSNATNKAVSWSSSDPTIASVSNDGMITANYPGIVTITVKTADGGFKSTCKVSVKNYTENVSETASFKTDKGGTANITFDENIISGSSYSYNHELARFCSLASMLTYSGFGTISDTLGTLGFVPPEKNRSAADRKNINKITSQTGCYFYWPNKEDTTSGRNCFVITQKACQNYNVVLVLLRGTYGNEWYSDFDCGTGEVHKDFNNGKNFVLNYLQQYIKANNLNKDKNLKIIITGHSRGAAVANLLGGSVDFSINQGIASSHGISSTSASNVYTYTFATPNTTTVKEKSESLYKNIFNFVNPEDFVTKVMPYSWKVSGNNYGRYGITLTLPSKTNEDKYKSKYYDKMNKLFKQYSNDNSYKYYEEGEAPVYRIIKKVTDEVSSPSIYYSKKLYFGYFSKISLYDFFKKTLCKIAADDADGWDYADIGLKMGSTYTNSLYISIVKFFLSNQAIDKYFENAHLAQTYAAFVNSMTYDEAFTYAKGDYRKGYKCTVNCPVDITITDIDTNEVVGKITDNVIDEEIAAKDNCIVMSIEGDSKIFWLPANGNYDIKLIGNDSGEMNVTLSDIDSDIGEVSRVNFCDIEVQNGFEYSLEIPTEDDYEPVDESDSEFDEPYESLVSVEDAYLVLETGENVLPDDALNVEDDDLMTLSVDVAIEGMGYTDEHSVVTKGDYLYLTASTDENNSFIGWFDSDGNLLSSASSYGFVVNESTTLVAKFTDNVVPVTSFSFTEETYYLEPEDIFIPEITYSPENANVFDVEFTSSDDNVITLTESSTLKAVNYGSAVVSAKYGDLTSTCTVTVVEDAYAEKTKFDKVSIKVASEKTIDYRSIVAIKATATDVPDGYKLAIYLGSQKVAEGDNKSVSYEYGEIKSDINYTVKVIDANGKVQKDSNGNELSKDGGKITCNAGFFKKLIAFFKGLFKSLPKVEVKP